MHDKKWDSWEYLKLRAQLAGIKVIETRNYAIFSNPPAEGAYLKATPNELEHVATWLRSQGVNLPGWDMTWPGESVPDLVMEQYERITEGGAFDANL